LAADLIRHDFDTMPAPSLTYAFPPDEKISRGFARVLGQISVRGRDLTRRSREPIDELIHEGRLLIKRVRALLWFARPVLDAAIYSRTLTRLRKAAGLLAGQRDLAVTRATLEELGRKASKARDRAAVAEIFRSLAGNPAAGEAPEEALRPTLQKAMEILCRSADEIKRSTARRTVWQSSSERLEEAFRAMRQAGKKARRTGKDADFHAWRKKAKRLLYQLELTQAEPGRRVARVMKRIGKLQETLGENQDGVVIEGRLRQMHPLPSSARRVLRLLEKRKARLRKRACEIARRPDAPL
jgi:CHAD domain-containing protein